MLLIIFLVSSFSAFTFYLFGLPSHRVVVTEQLFYFPFKFILSFLLVGLPGHRDGVTEHLIYVFLILTLSFTFPKLPSYGNKMPI